MRICFVSRRFFPAISGMSIYAVNLLRDYASRDFLRDRGELHADTVVATVMSNLGFVNALSPTASASAI